ncbi:YkgJ family cysteine cluster protein [Desulfovibrio litoralis]|uniref:Zinc-or iron-chelating domain-containing protein n=1 Tax=Desulfovibrio litoralis DSM 11393 TaxID=1121455 RepID=A0A1M7TJG9_9BACT|nr:hypothetical protein [Desulfovibrio litoralis]SHN70836.1 hypothetical protein SAMN02745728_02111 [Desulfovibrio litoralis DSM 11393]
MNTLDKSIEAFRLSMPEYEAKHQWLPLLLNCYAVIDFSVAQVTKKNKDIIACYKGCVACCYHTIPLSTIEVIGLGFYVNTILDQQLLATLLENFKTKPKICLFNLDGACVVYPMRPIACRRYMVAGQSCTINEDPLETRPNEVLIPSRRLLYTAVAQTLPFFQVRDIDGLQGEDVFDSYKKNIVELSSVYDKILKL